MTPREARRWELQHSLYLIVHYGPFCVAKGYDISQLSGAEVYALATKLGWLKA